MSDGNANNASPIALFQTNALHAVPAERIYIKIMARFGCEHGIARAIFELFGGFVLGMIATQQVRRFLNHRLVSPDGCTSVSLASDEIADTIASVALSRVLRVDRAAFRPGDSIWSLLGVVFDEQGLDDLSDEIARIAEVSVSPRELPQSSTVKDLSEKISIKLRDKR